MRFRFFQTGLTTALLLTGALFAIPADEKARESYWAFAPLSDPGADSEFQPPEVSLESWPTRDLDRFILANIEAAGHQPAPPADGRTLVRRAYIDLHGLPPSTEQIEAFLSDQRPDAWARLIDELLASPRYGERWGRHWLDVARYADSNGMDEDIAHPEAYRYRDYVIRSFNEDKPFDEFIVEQIAGDLLPAENLEQRRAQTVGVGFLSVGPKMLACDDPDKMRRDIVDEQIDTTGRAFLGMTLGCARCHDHKFDPISIKDYYGLAGIFMSTKTLTKYSVVAEFHQYDLSEPGHKGRRNKISELEKEKKNKKTAKERKKEIDGELAELRKGLPESFEVMGVTEDSIQDVRVHLRGDYQTLGDEVPRHVPVSLAGEEEHPVMPKDQSGRLELARWIASPRNPLTARVIANRIWRWHFGRGIVPTPDNFGKLGEAPTHPRLLDHLAAELVDAEWSLKALHRLIMNSATYRQSAKGSSEVLAADPENKLFARWLPRRVESEVLRDSILFKSNRLDLAMGGSMVVVRSNKYVDRAKRSEHLKSTRRTVYLPVLRSSGYDGQNAFDFADPAVVTGSRRSSTVTPQALFLMNSPLVHESSAALADLMLSATSEATPRDRTSWMILHILGREPREEEKERGQKFVLDYSSGDERAAWAAFARVLFSSNEFLYVD